MSEIKVIYPSPTAKITYRPVRHDGVLYVVQRTIDPHAIYQLWQPAQVKGVIIAGIDSPTHEGWRRWFMSLVDAALPDMTDWDQQDKRDVMAVLCKREYEFLIKIGCKVFPELRSAKPFNARYAIVEQNVKEKE